MTNEEFARKYANKMLDYNAPSWSRVRQLKVVGYFIGIPNHHSIHIPPTGIIVEYDSGYTFGGLQTISQGTTFVIPAHPLKSYWVVEQKYFILPTDDDVITKPMGVPAITSDKQASHYPHVCPRKGCGKPAYVSIFGGSIDCSSRICNHYK